MHTDVALVTGVRDAVADGLGAIRRELGVLSPQADRFADVREGWTTLKDERPEIRAQKAAPPRENQDRDCSSHEPRPQSTMSVRHWQFERGETAGGLSVPVTVHTDVALLTGVRRAETHGLGAIRRGLGIRDPKADRSADVPGCWATPKDERPEIRAQKTAPPRESQDRDCSSTHEPHPQSAMLVRHWQIRCPLSPGTPPPWP